MRRFASIASGLFACVTGCGDDGGARKLPDAPPVEDGPPIDMVAAGTVNVTTMSRCCTVAPNTPEPNIVVVSLSAEGSLVATATTGADGKASIEVREGGSVTAVYPEDADHENDLQTFVAVKPNDNLTFGEAYYRAQPPAGADGQMIVNWPAVTNATRYVAINSCTSAESTTLSVALSLSASCQTATSPVALVAYNASSELIASAYLPTANTAVGANIPANDVTWVTQTPGNAAISISSLDAAVTYVYLYGTGDYPIYGYGYNYGSASVNPKAGVASTTVSIPTTAPYKYASAELYRSGNFGRQYHYKGGVPPYAMTPGTVPWIEGQPLVSFSQRRAIWFETAGNYDAAVLFLDWRRSDGKVNHYFNWTLVLPPKVSDFRFPTPPAELEAFLPNAEDQVDSELTLVDLSSTTSYDATRALPVWRISNAQYAVSYGDEPSAGIATEGEGFSFND